MRISHRVPRRTLLLAVSGLAVLSMLIAALAAFHISVTHASPANQSLSTGGVTFASTPTSANIVAHYVVSPTGSGHGGAAAATDETPLAAKWPKGNGAASVVSNTGGVSGGGAGSAATNTATPGTTSSFIGQQASNITCPYFATGCNPPDMALAASPQFVFQGVNMQFEVLDLQGNPTSDLTSMTPPSLPQQVMPQSLPISLALPILVPDTGAASVAAIAFAYHATSRLALSSSASLQWPVEAVQDHTMPAEKEAEQGVEQGIGQTTRFVREQVGAVPERAKSRRWWWRSK